MEKKPKFVCDVMLGRLAKWLRMLGYDTLYRNDYDDYELLKIAIQTERTLLTRDTKLYEISGSKRAFFISSEIIEDQLREMFEIWDLDRKPKLQICPVCNEIIVAVEKKSSVRGKVPKYTYKTHDDFYICQNCGKVYWHGSHSKLADNFLMELDENQ
ncbi:MAG: Mut7-C RNAse domain-containing protein [Candidatus Zixiibacteriota bacterium]